MRSLQRKSNVAIRHMVDQIIASGQMSRQDHLSLTFILLAEDTMTDEDRNQVNRVFDYVQMGRLKLID